MTMPLRLVTAIARNITRSIMIFIVNLFFIVLFFCYDKGRF
jgi:hypothetical protein